MYKIYLDYIIICRSQDITLHRSKKISIIVQSNPNILTDVLGIGKKTAQRIVLELKNKILSSTIRMAKKRACNSRNKFYNQRNLDLQYSPEFWAFKSSEFRRILSGFLNTGKRGAANKYFLGRKHPFFIIDLLKLYSIIKKESF